MKMKKDNPNTNRIQRDAEGRRIINMIVRDDTDFLSPFSKGLIPVISADVAEYLENAAKPALPSEKLTLHIHSDCVDCNEEILYREAIAEYYGNSIAAVKRELRRSLITSVGLFVIGFLILILSHWLGDSSVSALWEEVFDITSWVFIWEATDISMFQMHSMRLEKRRYQAFLNIKIEFLSLECTD